MFAFVARAQVPICNGSYSLVTTMAEPDCNGGQGQVTLSIQNYTGIFKAKWLADGDEVLSKSLYAGTYTYKVWIPGVPGCSNIGESPTYSVDVTQPTPVQPNASIKSYPSCAPSQSPTGPDGVLEVAPSGGTSTFLYKVDWDPVTGSTAFQNGTSFTSGDYERLGTGPGTYYVAVRDDNGCLGQESVNMPSGIPAAMTMGTFVTNPSCAGQKGEITLNIGNGANLPLRYSLLNPTDVTDTIATNLVGTFTNVDEGTYKVSVTDQAGCTVQGNYGVNAPNPLQFSLENVQNVKCFGESDASIAFTLSGGTSPVVIVKDLALNTIIQQALSVTMQNSSGQRVIERFFSSGDYFVYATDQQGCLSDTTYFTIDEPVSLNSSPQLSISESIINACFPGTQSGKVIVTGTGGYPGLTYALWSGNRTNNQDQWERPGVYSWVNNKVSGEYENLSPGTYTIGVKDQYGCQRRKLVSMGTQPEISVTQQALTNVDCNANSTGSITVSASGGLAPLTYELLPAGTQQTSPTVTGLSAGPYQVKVIDDYGCESSPLSFDIAEPDVLVATITSTSNPACNPGSGRIWYTITGGTLNYQVLLNGALSRTITTLNSGYSQSVSQGTYTFQVKDENGCESLLDNFTISGPPSPGAPPNSTTGLSLSVGGFQHVSCPSGSNGFIQLGIQGGWPATGGYTIEVETVTSYVDRLGNTRTNYTPYRTTNNSLVDNLPAGTYRIRVKDSYGCSRTVQQTIVQPDPIVPNFNGITGNCGGSGSSTQANGGVTLNGISGGTPPYSYTLNGTFYTDIPNFFPNLNLSGVNMVITDNNNCVRYYP
jgi:large repetitive protein